VFGDDAGLGLWLRGRSNRAAAREFCRHFVEVGEQSTGTLQGPRRGWVPLDRRQVEIHRLLGVFGPVPAAFYADACRLLATDPLMASTTHLVGHLLRELESALREVLRPMVPTEQAASSFRREPESLIGHHLRKIGAALQKILRLMVPTERAASSSRREPGSKEREASHKQQIDAIATALGFPADDEVRSLWKSLELQRVGHRGSQLGPRPVDADFRALWDSVQILLLRLGRQFESSFTASLLLIDELAGREKPDGSDMKELRGMPHNVVALERFFTQARPGWFPLLYKKGYLSDPPPLEVADDDTIAYVRWPAGQYLARMAIEPTIKRDVIEVALALETDNPQAHECVAEAALALSAADGASLAPKIASFLASPYQWALPPKVRDLIARLAQAGQADAAMLLLRSLLEAETGRRGGGRPNWCPNSFRRSSHSLAWTVLRCWPTCLIRPSTSAFRVRGPGGTSPTAGSARWTAGGSTIASRRSPQRCAMLRSWLHVAIHQASLPWGKSWRGGNGRSFTALPFTSCGTSRTRL
jgi:hypothetical protein